MKTRPIVIVAILLIGIVAGAAWFLQMKPEGDLVPGEVPASPAATPAVVARVEPFKENAPITGTPAAATPAPAMQATNRPEPVALTEWEVKIDQVLGLPNTTEAQTAQLLINLLPTLPPEGQADCAQHIANLTEDKDYAKVVPLIKNPNLSEETQDALIMDLTNREEAIKLPVLLEVAKIPNHPYHEEALSDLQVYLDQDFGNNWQQWDKGVKDYLLKQKAEEAGAEAPMPVVAPGAPRQ